MVTIFGRPAVEVENPDGEVVRYLVLPVPASPGVWRAWVLTKPDGGEYRVHERPNGRWGCSCKAFAFGRGSECKHIEGVKSALQHDGASFTTPRRREADLGDRGLLPDPGRGAVVDPGAGGARGQAGCPR